MQANTVNTDPKKIDEVLSRGVVDVIVKEELRKEMLSGRQLSIYLGTDPTGGDLHLGHATIHKKLRDFQELGHKVTLLVGDFTVLVGDHSDKNDQRIEVTRKDIEENMKNYTEQFGRTVDMSQVEVVYNSTWLKPLNFNDLIELASVFTLQQMSERDAFQKRVAAGNPVGFDELLYPLMQGYDAYALKTDIQIGGTDQLFNMQAGRKIMEHFGLKPQAIITTPLLVGNDGRKMGKSLKNFISINSSAFDKYAGVMSIVDEIIVEYFTLLTRIPMDEVAEMGQAIKSGSVNPMELKKKLAYEITKDFHGATEAGAAQKQFESVVQGGEVPKDAPEVKLSGEFEALELIMQLNMAPSKSEAKRLIEQGAVEIDGNIVSENHEKISIKPGSIVRVGKRKYTKII